MAVEPFLVELCSSIYEASESEEVYVPGSRAGTIFRAGMEEIERLEAHPLLIPDPSLRMRFGALAEEIRERHERARKARELAVAAHEIAREEEEIIDGVNHPMFRPDLKPWEQFLLKDSPGSGLTLPDHPPHVMYQVMPYAGALLKENWMKTLVELEERILNVSTTLPLDYAASVGHTQLRMVAWQAPLPANVARREGPVSLCLRLRLCCP
ncbi:hypothetical protein KEM52_000236 [Ascosphaera acerosa]|nr:hypothetical protein KEM52_000236 [Ascosphaera acerosa]